MCLGVCRGVGACDSAEGHDVRDGIAADAVAAMDSARDFTCCEEAGKGLARLRLYFSRRIDRHTTHRVMDARGDEGGVVGSLVERDEHFGTAEGFILAEYAQENLCA